MATLYQNPAANYTTESDSIKATEYFCNVLEHIGEHPLRTSLHKGLGGYHDMDVWNTGKGSKLIRSYGHPQNT